MPSVSLHLDQKIVETIKAKASAAKMPVSQVLRNAVERYLDEEERKAAKERVLRSLGEKPFGGMKEWRKLHRERTGDDACKR